MTELRAITEENFLDAFRLRLAPGQEDFVSHPIRSLAQAYVYRDQCQPFGIYAKGKMIGYVMVIYDRDIPEYDIWHMMIDESVQGRGYGSDAMDRVIEYIRTKPFGSSDRVALTCNKKNPAARKLYESKGFSATGNEVTPDKAIVFDDVSRAIDGAKAGGFLTCAVYDNIGCGGPDRWESFAAGCDFSVFKF